MQEAFNLQTFHDKERPDDKLKRKCKFDLDQAKMRRIETGESRLNKAGAENDTEQNEQEM